MENLQSSERKKKTVQARSEVNVCSTQPAIIPMGQAGTGATQVRRRPAIIEVMGAPRKWYPRQWRSSLLMQKLCRLKAAGAVLPKMPDQLPSISQLKAMNQTARALYLMMHIASLAIIVEMLKTGCQLPGDDNISVNRQMRNAQQRLRMACHSAEKAGLWHNVRWQIGSLLMLTEKYSTRKSTK